MKNMLHASIAKVKYSKWPRNSVHVYAQVNTSICIFLYIQSAAKLRSPPPRWSAHFVLKTILKASWLEQSTKNRAKRSKNVENFNKNKQNIDQKPHQKSMENQPKIKPKSIQNQPKINQRSIKNPLKFDQNRKMSRTSSWEPSWKPLGGVLGAS